MKEYILWFAQISKDDTPRVGGKGANLGEIFNLGIPVPPGFCVTVDAYFDFLRQNQLDQEIHALLKGLDVSQTRKLTKASKEIQQKILKTKIPAPIEADVVTAWQKLSAGKKIKVAVRSSATAEDLPGASFAGQQKTFLNVAGKDGLLQALKACWASLFEARAIFYRAEKEFDQFKVGLAVPVQKMVASEVSGVMFTVDPLSNDQGKIAIEAVWGLGEAIVSGSVTPDQYLVDKESVKILDRKVVAQKKMVAGKSKWVPVSAAYQDQPKLSDKLISQIAILGKKIEQHYGFPQDIEWAVDGGKVYIVQTRPVTTLDIDTGNLTPKASKGESKDPPTPHPPTPTLLLEGISASPGIATGKVKILKSAKEVARIKKGDVLVAEMTNPDYVPAMKKAVAIVTDSGGKTSHAAIVSRELGIPCIVGTEMATKMLKTGEVITVDGAKGKIYEGEIEGRELRVEDRNEDRGLSIKGKQLDPSSLKLQTSSPPSSLKTATKVYVNLAEPERANEVSQMDVDGVGLLRAEFMVAQIGEHPRYALEHKRGDQYTQKLYENLLTFARAFDPRPVVYRTTDLRSNEYKNLKGGEKYEKEEQNPMLGFRGVMRYLADEEVFRMELKAIQEVRRYHKNLWVMLPFVRTPKELIEAKKIMSSVGLHRGGSFKLWMMVEVPSTVVLLEQFIGVGIDGVSIGSNDLTQLMLGLDRDNSRVANLFDERDPAVTWAIKRVIRQCRLHGVTASICGQAPSIYPDLTRDLVRLGITSVSVSPDAIAPTRKVIAEAEWHLVRTGRSQN